MGSRLTCPHPGELIEPDALVCDHLIHATLELPEAYQVTDGHGEDNPGRPKEHVQNDHPLRSIEAPRGLVKSAGLSSMPGSPVCPVGESTCVGCALHAGSAAKCGALDRACSSHPRRVLPTSLVSWHTNEQESSNQPQCRNVDIWFE